MKSVETVKSDKNIFRDFYTIPNLKFDVDKLRSDLDKVLKSQIFIDTIYNPYETKLIRYCKKNASKAIGGVDMFIFQAIESLKIWEEDVIDMDIDINKIKKVLKSKLC